MEEGVVVGGAGGRNFAQQEIDVTGGGDGLASCGVLGAEGSVIAVDGRTRGDLCGGARGEMKRNAGLHSARSADQRYASSPPGRHRTGPHGYVRQPRLRFLQLPILRKRPNHHRHPSHQFLAARNSCRPRHRLQRLPPCRPVRPSPALHPRWTLTHGPATISNGLSVCASLPFAFTRICLDFWLPCVILPLGYICVTVDVPVARSPEASFPQLTLTLFS